MSGKAVIDQYRAWLVEEIADATRNEAPTLNGLSLAMYGLRLLIEARPAALVGHCGALTYYHTSAALCWQPEGHDGEHDKP